MTSMKVAAAAGMLLLTLLSAGGPAGALGATRPPPAPAQTLRLFVTPRFARAPAIVRIQAFVEPGAENRQLEFIVESIDYFRSSVIELNGADTAHVHGVEFRSVPVGTHDVRVVLTGRTGVRAVAYDRVAVVE